MERILKYKIKQKYLDKIINGEKSIEFRDEGSIRADRVILVPEDGGEEKSFMVKKVKVRCFNAAKIMAATPEGGRMKPEEFDSLFKDRKTIYCIELYR